MTMMKLAIVSPKIEAKSCQSEVLPARLRRICGTGFWAKMKTPTMTTKMPPMTRSSVLYCSICVWSIE